MDENLGREYLIGRFKKLGLSRRRTLRVLNVLFREINQALAGGEEVEFAGGRLLRMDPARVNRSRYDEENWPAHWPLWTVVWVPHWETLPRLVGREEAEKKAMDFLFDDVFSEEYMAWVDAEWKRARASARPPRAKIKKARSRAESGVRLTGKQLRDTPSRSGWVMPRPGK